MSGEVARRYAKALFEVAAEKGLLDTVEAELKSIQEILVSHPDFLQLLQHPQIEKTVKQEQFGKVFEGKLSETTVQFMKLLLERNRENALKGIIEYFVQLANEQRGIEDAVVTTIKPLTEDEKQSIANHFGQLINKKIRVENVVDPTIVGGVIVRIGDRLYDGSVKGKLNRFKKQIV